MQTTKRKTVEDALTLLKGIKVLSKTDRRYIAYWDEGYHNTDANEYGEEVKILSFKELIDLENMIESELIYDVVQLKRGEICVYDATPMIYNYGLMYILRVK